MDILYTDNVDDCLVSSDSDFTRLASRLRESGRMVIGMGEKKTPTPFRRACDVFTTLELLVQNKRNEKGGGSNAVPKDSVEQAVVDIITDNQNNGKATGLGEIGSRLQKRYPDFDVRSYGTNLLSKLLEEFTRVRITKDHSSVTVELAEGGAEGEARACGKPEGAGRPRGREGEAGQEEAADVTSELDGEAAATEASSAETGGEAREAESPLAQPSRHASSGDEDRRALGGGSSGCRRAARGRGGAASRFPQSGCGGAGVRGRRSGRGGSAGDRTRAPGAQKDVQPSRHAASGLRPARRRKPMPPKWRANKSEESTRRRISRRRPISPRRRKSRRGAARTAKSKAEENPAAKKVAPKKETAEEARREEEHGQEGGPRRRSKTALRKKKPAGDTPAGYIRELSVPALAPRASCSPLSPMRCVPSSRTSRCATSATPRCASTWPRWEITSWEGSRNFRVRLFPIIML